MSTQPIIKPASGSGNTAHIVEVAGQAHLIGKGFRLRTDLVSAAVATGFRAIMAAANRFAVVRAIATGKANDAIQNYDGVWVVRDAQKQVAYINTGLTPKTVKPKKGEGYGLATLLRNAFNGLNDSSYGLISRYDLDLEMPNKAIKAGIAVSVPSDPNGLTEAQVAYLVALVEGSPNADAQVALKALNALSPTAEATSQA